MHRHLLHLTLNDIDSDVFGACCDPIDLCAADVVCTVAGQKVSDEDPSPGIDSVVHVGGCWVSVGHMEGHVCGTGVCQLTEEKIAALLNISHVAGGYQDVIGIYKEHNRLSNVDLMCDILADKHTMLCVTLASGQIIIMYHF